MTDVYDDNTILCKFHWECGRQGDLIGVFVTTQDELESLIGREICFGEVLGKHSNVTGVFEQKDVTVLTQDPDFITKAIDFGLVPLGPDPREYQWKDDKGDWHDPNEE